MKIKQKILIKNIFIKLINNYNYNYLYTEYNK